MNKTFLTKQVQSFFDFTVTAASSAPEQVGQPYVILKLKLLEGNMVNDTIMEMKLPQFYDFLHDLEKTHSAMQKYINV